MPQQANTGSPTEGPEDLERLAANIIRHMRSPNTHRVSVDTAQWAELTGQDGEGGAPDSPPQRPAVILSPDPPILLHRAGQKPALLHSLMVLPEDEGRRVVLFLNEGLQIAMTPPTSPTREKDSPQEGTLTRDTALGLMAACVDADRVEIVLRTAETNPGRRGRPGPAGTGPAGTGYRRLGRTPRMKGPLGEDVSGDADEPGRHDVSGHIRMGRHRLKDGTWRITREWVTPHTRSVPHPAA